MISKAFSLEMETMKKIEQFKNEGNMNTSQAANTLIKLGYAYSEFLKEKKVVK